MAMADLRVPALAAASLLLLAGCGLKGDLYLPPEPESAAPPVLPEPATSEEQSRSDEER
jgi:predicted small lipoprotein YifL